MRFVCTANIDAIGSAAPRSSTGNRKVLAARLSRRCANSFGKQDLKVPLADQAAKPQRTSCSMRSWAPSPTRSSAWRNWRGGLCEDGSDHGFESPGSGRWRRTPTEGGLQPESSIVRTTPTTASGPSTSLVTDGEELRLATLAEQRCISMQGRSRHRHGRGIPRVAGHHRRPSMRAPRGSNRPRSAEAIRDHYKPVGQGDEVPTSRQ